MLISTATAEVATPEAVLALAGDRPLRPIWLNELGGLTFEIGATGLPDPMRGVTRPVATRWTPSRAASESSSRR